MKSIYTPLPPLLSHLSSPTLTYTRHQPHHWPHDLLQLRPLLCNKPQDDTNSHLPPLILIHSSFSSSGASSPSLSSPPLSSSSASPSPVAESISTFPSPQQDQDLGLENKHWSSVLPAADRKGSLALILNSDPELRELEREENQSGYLSHFKNPPTLGPGLSNMLKRGRPRQLDLTNNKPNSFKKQRRCQKSKKQQQHNNQIGLDVLEDSRRLKGLRHFSRQVCDKVAKRGTTTYNEIADELTTDIRDSLENTHSFDQKNIRRRVYDALNVLMGINIIAKDKKEIKWLGIPGPNTLETSQREADLLREIEEEERCNAELTASVEAARQSPLFLAVLESIKY
ncbi:E2F/DP family winged-helix DNA-binding domain-containing protein [Phycomyces nitens]|nr:E2F/DP family winged-helix DNA-binding domain-containing protein [Phycomyces nitens]